MGEEGGTRVRWSQILEIATRATRARWLTRTDCSLHDLEKLVITIERKFLRDVGVALEGRAVCAGGKVAWLLRRERALAAERARLDRAQDTLQRLREQTQAGRQAARLDVVEYASAEGTAAAYDVSVVTSLRADRRFVARCAANPGYAAAARVHHKLQTQYAGRVPGARLVPLVVEAGGRWHLDAELLLYFGSWHELTCGARLAWIMGP